MAQMDKADSLKFQGKYSEALKIYEQNLTEDLTSGNKRNQSVDYNNIGNIYSDIGDYEKSTDFYFKAIKIAEELGNK